MSLELIPIFIIPTCAFLYECKRQRAGERYKDSGSVTYTWPWIAFDTLVPKCIIATQAPNLRNIVSPGQALSTSAQPDNCTSPLLLETEPGWKIVASFSGHSQILSRSHGEKINGVAWEQGLENSTLLPSYPLLARAHKNGRLEEEQVNSKLVGIYCQY